MATTVLLSSNNESSRSFRRKRKIARSEAIEEGFLEEMLPECDLKRKWESSR